jgi:glucose-1-phosphate thymidylyltransferase
MNATKPSIMEYFGSGSRLGVDVAYVCQEDFSDQGKSAGLSLALDSAYPWIREKAVAFGMPDTIVEPTTCFVSLLEAVFAGADLALGLFPTDKPHKFGMVQLDSNNTVERIVDKPVQTNLQFMWGTIAWSHRFTEHLHQTMVNEPTDFADVMNRAISRGLAAKGIVFQGGRYLDLGTYDDLARLKDFFDQ